MESLICPGCERRVRERDADQIAIFWRDEWWHRTCQLKSCGEYDAILKLFEMQDEPDVDPQSSMADLISNIGHFCTIHNKRKRGDRRINFADAVRVGLSHYEEETEA